MLISSGMIGGCGYVSLLFERKFARREHADIFGRKLTTFAKCMHCLVLKRCGWESQQIAIRSDSNICEMKNIIGKFVRHLSQALGLGSPFHFNIACPKVLSLSNMIFMI